MIFFQNMSKDFDISYVTPTLGMVSCSHTTVFIPQRKYTLICPVTEDIIGCELLKLVNLRQAGLQVGIEVEEKCLIFSILWSQNSELIYKRYEDFCLLNLKMKTSE